MPKYPYLLVKNRKRRNQKKKKGKRKEKRKIHRDREGAGSKDPAGLNQRARSPGSIAVGHSFTPRNPAGGVGGSAGAELNGGR